MFSVVKLIKHKIIFSNELNIFSVGSFSSFKILSWLTLSGFLHACLFKWSFVAILNFIRYVFFSKNPINIFKHFGIVDLNTILFGLSLWNIILILIMRVISKYYVLILIQICYCWLLKFFNPIYKLTWNSHIMNIDKMFVFFNEKEPNFINHILDLKIIMERFKLRKNYLLAQYLVCAWIICMVNKESKSGCTKPIINEKVILIWTLWKKSISNHV